MTMLDSTCSAFIEVLASKAPVPGGGGAAAMGGAIGMALSNMVGNLTVGKKKYADVEGEVKDLIVKGDNVILKLKELVDQDAEVFEPLSKAYGLPKNTPEEVKFKEETMEKCCIAACGVPMDIMRACFEGIKIHARMGEIGTMIAISDVGCGVVFLKSALIAGSLNVIINLNTIKDQVFVSATRKEMEELIATGSKMADDTLALVISKLKK
ncbi:MAG: cyclodeaminase/cyclohydrolase family protein [Proteobacteria bacterium]|nr:cyclodeaminase/cyclohydrolase family protein [Desulfobacteraceae bacterium]MBU4053477.1 cyclodeaminase/cyclohydrolase family protein [Pseudomonadota bacterium]MBU4315948.1 cyclodeaminase/cyclohydrolase family protein [Pseudomonadota bacterium]MBU4471438.1 cyclodeaminase/cyclohydrolase family protein [Pseudomonadota bacterium]MCG2752443.1 cyclodeaminase/cyclohydrolase family protein [Desulfobacteraceae bacterium]